MPLKPSLKRRTADPKDSTGVPPIRIPHGGMPADAMEAVMSSSSRGVSVRFSDTVVKHDIPAYGRSEPVPKRVPKAKAAAPPSPVPATQEVAPATQEVAPAVDASTDKHEFVPEVRSP